MKKIMIIGAGIGQINLIEKARERGLKVIAVSPMGNYPGLSLADEVLPLDIYDRDAIVDYARKEKIDAVTSDQNDLMMPTVAYIAETLGIPGNSFQQALAYSNKNLFRDNCKKLEIPSPKHAAVATIGIPSEMVDVPFPWIIKPEDSQSSIGVTKVNSEDELPPALELAISKSKNRRAIAEEFFPGHEAVCEGFIYKGKYYLLGFADRRYFKLSNMFIPTQTIFPSTVKQDYLDKIVGYETKMASYINPKFGIVHSEYLINLETGEIRVVESALRGGGVFISSHLVPMATGIDINQLLLDCALGEEKNVESKLAVKKKRASAYICFYLPEGEVVDIRGIDKLKKLPFVKKTDLGDLKIGMHYEKMLHKGMRKGPIIVDADTREEMENNIAIVQNTLQVDVLNAKEEICPICWE